MGAPFAMVATGVNGPLTSDEDDMTDHETDHEHDEAAGEHVDAQAVHDAFLDVVAAVEEHFGDREPDEDELRAFLRQRLLAEGRSEAEVEAILRDL